MTEHSAISFSTVIGLETRAFSFSIYADISYKM